MSTRMHLRCDGCNAKTLSEPIVKKFFPRDHPSSLLGTWRTVDLDFMAPKGWRWFDTQTGCTYCPTCWAGIENGAALTDFLARRKRDGND